MKTLALATLLLASPVLAEPSARLLPSEPPPAAVDFTGSGKWIAVGVVSGALLTALATVLAIIVQSHASGLAFPTTVMASNGPR
jgi:hypothetical protein